MSTQPQSIEQEVPATASPVGEAAAAPVVIDANGIGKRYELHRHRSILLKDAARLVFQRVETDYFWALRDVSFQVRRGETVGIIGPNGAGKSTLLSLIARTATPTEGTIQIKGRVSALLELGAGFHPDFTGRENIFINGIVMGLTRAEIEAKFDEIVSFSELGRFIDEPVRNYSSGMLARLGFSVASSVDPDILIVDEALSVGDAAFQEKSFNRIQEYRKRGCTILLVTHSTELVEKMCERAVLISHGQILAQGPADQVCAEYRERAASQRLVGSRPPYEKVQSALWKRALAFASLALLVGTLSAAAVKFVLTSDAPAQRPAILKKFEP